MKKIKLVVMILTIFLVVGCGKENLSEEKQYDGITYQETNKRTNNVVINLENDKKIVLELYSDIAPITVKNFQKLVEDDFYNDIIFHRVVRDFVIQAGDGTSLGRNANTIKGEFSNNGINNSLLHEQGVISMARTTNNMNSASSQFFIMLKDNKSLDGDYAAFGRVIAGLDNVLEIGKVVVDKNDKPLKDIKILSMEFVRVK